MQTQQTSRAHSNVRQCGTSGMTRRGEKEDVFPVPVRPTGISYNSL